MPSHKIERISSEIAQSISNILLTEARDEFLRSITITGWEVTNDLGYAKVYFTSMLDKDPKYLEREMNEASKFIRGRLSEQVDIRHTPELRFIFDSSVE